MFWPACGCVDDACATLARDPRNKSGDDVLGCGDDGGGGVREAQ